MTEKQYPPGFDKIHLVYHEFTKRTRIPSFPKFGLGEASIAENGPVPRICFVDTGGTLISGVEQVPSTDGFKTIYTDQTEWTVHIWAKTREELLALFYELIRAMRDALGERNVDATGNYELSGDYNTNRSRKLTHEGIVLREPVSESTDFDFELVEVQSFETDVGTVAAIPGADTGEDDETPEELTHAELNESLGPSKVSITQPKP